MNGVLINDEIIRAYESSYWERFGLTEPTGIDLPNEASSLIAKMHEHSPDFSFRGQQNVK